MTTRRRKQSVSQKTPRKKTSPPDQKTGRSAPLSQSRDDTDQPLREPFFVVASVSSGLRVLIAEDEPTLRGLMAKIFERRNQQAIIVGSGEEAIARWQAEPFDVILMDVQMPGMDGLETVSRIRELEKQAAGKKRVPVIALTAHARQEDVKRCIAAGMDDHVSKPLEIKALFKLIEKYVDSSGREEK